MNISQNLNDDAILKELGQRLIQRRIELSLTQQDLAEQAGIGKRTLERLEAGSSIQTSNFVRILRKLALLDSLGALIPETGPRPMDLLKLQGKTRKRVSSPRKKNRGKNGSPYKDEPSAQWSWVSEP
jgi:transcriptional regulator with XRE-family HTH domain